MLHFYHLDFRSVGATLPNKPTSEVNVIMATYYQVAKWERVWLIKRKIRTSSSRVRAMFANNSQVQRHPREEI